MDTNSLKMCSRSLCAHALVDDITPIQLLTKNRKKEKKKERKKTERKEKRRWSRRFSMGLRVVGGLGLDIIKIYCIHIYTIVKE